MKNYFKILLPQVILIMVINISVLSAQSATDAKFQGVMIYHFTQQITWPQLNNNFIIGVLGETPLSKVLQEIAVKRNVKGKRILVRNYSSLDQIDGCNIVFIAKSEKGKLKDVISKVKNNKTLVVSESPGAAKQGSGINFIKKDGKIKFEINKGIVTQSGLSISGTLEKLAVKVI